LDVSNQDINRFSLWGMPLRVWSNIASFSPDQLCQRMAWALSQIFVVNLNSESIINYYDIFVHNAFGNYFDVMKEVSYSPMMGRMLSYIGSRSYQSSGNAPDENFARELMQLFSIGIWKLNKNGTLIRNQNGGYQETYSMKHIQSFARIWTGFVIAEQRGNVDQAGSNQYDPMLMIASNHDSFPKHGLDRFHIGDEYPLCISLPRYSFLRKGAKYRFIGSEIRPTKTSRISNFDLSGNSPLYNTLCPLVNGKCEFKSIVILPSNLNCFGVECELDTVRIVKVGIDSTNFVYYEYVERPCVQLEFPESGIVSTSLARAESICVDKKSIRASTACCTPPGTFGNVQSKYDGELTSFETSQARCSAIGQNLCVLSGVSSSRISHRVWTSGSCSVQAQVYDDGIISVVHTFGNVWQSPQLSGLQANSNIRFEVNWKNNLFPTVGQQCGGICQVSGLSCICPTSTSRTIGFTSIPSVSAILRN
jgi:hypothetical protein